MKIFISHASVDTELVKAFVQLLKLGIGVPTQDIFFSSAQGNIPNGEFFVQKILTELGNSNLCISIISKQYLKSQFCLEELGAAQVRNIGRIADFFTLIVPPADFPDLSAVLLGTQSGRILESGTLDDLHDHIKNKIGQHASTATWNEERNKFLEKAGRLVSVGKAKDLLAKLVLTDLFFDRQETANITYKLKLRVLFRNETGLEVVVKKPRWHSAPTEVQVRPDWNSAVEAGAGAKNEEWHGDLAEMKIKPNQTFRVWIGLDWAHSDIELRQLHETLRVGTLVLPVLINNHEVELERKI